MGKNFKYTAGHLTVTFNQNDFWYGVKGVRIATSEYNTRSFNQMPGEIQAVVAGRKFRRAFHVWASARQLENRLQPILKAVEARRNADAIADKAAIAYVEKIEKENAEMRALESLVQDFVTNPLPSKMDDLIAALKTQTNPVSWAEGRYAGLACTTVSRIAAATLGEVTEFAENHAAVIADFDRLVADITPFAEVVLMKYNNSASYGGFELSINHNKGVRLWVPNWVHPDYRTELCDAAFDRYAKLTAIEAHYKV